MHAPDPWQSMDPWKEYKLKQSPQPPGKAAAPVPVPRSLPADTPIATKFQEHDSRMCKLEQAVQSLQEGQDDQRRQAQCDKEAMAQSLQTMGQQFAASLEAMQKAQQRQQEQLFQGMAELKSIVLSGGAVDSQEKRRKSSNEAMQLDDAKH